MNRPAQRSALLKAPAKLTLSLRVDGTRPNGYHEIDAEMVALDLADDVELELGGPTTIEVVSESSITEADVIPTGPDNLIAKALDHVGLEARVRLLKRIPAQAGLGGGSADAAAVLRWAGVTDPAEVVALGADVAFCLIGGRARVTGIGEHIDRLPYEELAVTLMKPPIACSTVDVFKAWDKLGGPKGPGVNDLEQAALAIAPGLGRWREMMAEATGQEPQLAGSGSTWFVRGAFPGDNRVVAKTVPEGWNG